MRIRRELKLIHVIILTIAVVFYAGAKFISTAGKGAAAVNEGTAFVARAVDGDTLKLSDGRRVRLIGVDTPELHYSEKLLRDSRRTHKDVEAIQALGKKAADFTRHLCEGKTVRIELDVRRYDKYGRLLAYIYLEDGTFVNARKITALPYLAARKKYPIGCKVLQRERYMESGTVFETRMVRHLKTDVKGWQAEFEQALHSLECINRLQPKQSTHSKHNSEERRL